MTVVATLMAASLALPAGQVVHSDSPRMMVQDPQAPITYRATRRDRSSRAYPEIMLVCSGREMRFKVSGLHLPDNTNTPLQMQIGNWAQPLYRPSATQSDLIAQASPALLAAVRSQSQMVIRVSNKTYRLRPLDGHQHTVFTQGCALSRDASVGPDLSPQLRPEEPLID